MRATQAAALMAVALVLLIFGYLLKEALPLLSKTAWPRFFSGDWDPSGATASAGFNLLPMLVGSLLATLIAVLLAAPIGLALAACLQFYAPTHLAVNLRRVLGLLAGIPSVVFGFWALVEVVPWLAVWQPPGASLLAASLVLAVMILPTVALLADAALAAVPPAQLRAALALGLSPSTRFWAVSLPAARAGVVSAILLAAARALGETMAVLMVAGNVVQLPDSLFAPVRTLTANMALEMAYALGDHRAALFVSGLLLLLVALLLVVMATRPFAKAPQLHARH